MLGSGGPFVARLARLLLALSTAAGLCAAQPAQLDDVLAAAAAAGGMDADGDGQVTSAEFLAWADAQHRQFAASELAPRAGDASLATGSANCPCINPWRADVDAGTCRNHTSAAGESVCVHDEYGAGRCAAWDAEAGSAACEPTSKDWWCQEWCYVNASACLRPRDPSAYNFDPATVDGELFYSYATCGTLDRYKEIRLSESLRGKNLRVSFPGDSSAKHALYTNEDTGERGGSMVDFMEEVKAAGNFTWTVKEISNISLSQYSSSYTACKMP